MAEANYNDAVTFLRRVNHCLEQGRRAEDFFNLLTTEDALRQKVCESSSFLFASVTFLLLVITASSVSWLWNSS